MSPGPGTTLSHLHTTPPSLPLGDAKVMFHKWNWRWRFAGGGGQGPFSLHSLARPEEEKQECRSSPRVYPACDSCWSPFLFLSLSNRRRTRLSRPSILETKPGSGHGGRSSHTTPPLVTCVCVRVTGEIKARRRIFLVEANQARGILEQSFRYATYVRVCERVCECVWVGTQQADARAIIYSIQGQHGY